LSSPTPLHAVPDLAFTTDSAAAADGFRWVEFWDCEEAPPVEISRRLAEAGLRVALINVSPGWEADDCAEWADPGASMVAARVIETLVAAELLAPVYNLLAGHALRVATSTLTRACVSH